MREGEGGRGGGVQEAEGKGGGGEGEGHPAVLDDEERRHEARALGGFRILGGLILVVDCPGAKGRGVNLLRKHRRRVGCVDVVAHTHVPCTG
jgi:hypothetical protein